MIVYSVSVQVTEGNEEDFRKATKANYKETRKELGNIRFDVLQSVEDPCHFVLYEVYRSDEAVTAHKATAHYKVWRETVAPWMSRDRNGERFNPLLPVEESAW